MTVSFIPLLDGARVALTELLLKVDTTKSCLDSSANLNIPEPRIEFQILSHGGVRIEFHGLKSPLNRLPLNVTYEPTTDSFPSGAWPNGNNRKVHIRSDWKIRNTTHDNAINLRDIYGSSLNVMRKVGLHGSRLPPYA